MLKIFGLLLLFSSISLLTYFVSPYFISVFRLYHKIQNQRTEKVGKELDRMFLFTERKRLRRIFTITIFSLGLLGFAILRNPIGLLIGVVLGLISPAIVIKNISWRRRNKFQTQLVDSLMLVSSSLKAGMSLSQAFEVLATEMPPPISEEFALVLRENRMGVSLEEGLNHLKQRIQLDDLDLISTAISISRDSGGDLTDVLGNLVFTIREKRKLDDRVRTLTVQGRLQGAIMGILPIGFGVFVYFINPHNFDIMLKDKLGQMLLIAAVALELVGIISIRILSKVEV